jgi:hypothetical protein
MICLIKTFAQTSNVTGIKQGSFILTARVFAMFAAARQQGVRRN